MTRSGGLAMGEGDRILPRIAEAFESLAAGVGSSSSSDSDPFEAAVFSRACSLISPLFGTLGIAFKFAEMDYVAKVEDLIQASKHITSLHSMLELDIQQNSVKKPGSHTRNLLRVKRGLDMIRLLFENIVIEEGNSLKQSASVAYEQVFAQHHGWAIRKAVAAGMYALPSKSQLLQRLNADEASARLHMQKYAETSVRVIRYVEDLYISRELGIDW